MCFPNTERLLKNIYFRYFIYFKNGNWNSIAECNFYQDSKIIVATMTLHFHGSPDQYQVSPIQFYRHAEELARIDYNQKEEYSQDNTDARSPVS